MDKVEILTQKRPVEWFHELPEWIKVRAANGIIKGYENNMYDNLIEALSGSIAWRATKEGFEFWQKATMASVVGDYSKINIELPNNNNKAIIEEIKFHYNRIGTLIDKLK